MTVSLPPPPENAGGQLYPCCAHCGPHCDGQGHGVACSTPGCPAAPASYAGPATYQGQLAGRVNELLPDVGEAERLELLGAMDEGDLRTSMAFILSLYPQVFDHSLVRDRELVGRLLSRLGEGQDDEDYPEPFCGVCGATIGIFLNRGTDWNHYRGQGTLASPVELYDTDHPVTVAWREAGTK